MNFCSACGARVTLRVPDGDTMPRYVCDQCRTIHYQNPKIVVGCVPQWEDKVLLCRRAIEPRYGQWTFPAGFMENHETVAEAAMRETLEEACARVELGKLYALYNLPHIDQVYLIFRARLLDLDFMPGVESLETRLFGEEEIPWEDLAFTAVHNTLAHHFEDARKGAFGFHMCDIVPANPDPKAPFRFGTVIPHKARF